MMTSIVRHACIYVCVCMYVFGPSLLSHAVSGSKHHHVSLYVHVCLCVCVCSIIYSALQVATRDDKHRHVCMYVCMYVFGPARDMQHAVDPMPCICMYI